MDVQVAPEIKSNPVIASGIPRATHVFDDVIGASSGLVKAVFDLVTDDRGRTLVRLRLSDFTGQVEARFAPEELANDVQLERRALRIWGDLLQVRSHQQVAKMQELAAALEGKEGGDQH